MKEYAIGLIISCFTLILPVTPLIYLMAGFIFFDTFVAIVVVLRLKGWSGFTSGKLFNTAVKIFFYLGGILLAFGINKAIVQQPLFGINFFLAKLLTVAFVCIEIKSIDETQMKITKKSGWTFLKEILEKAKTLKKDFNEVIDK